MTQGTGIRYGEPRTLATDLKARLIHGTTHRYENGHVLDAGLVIREEQSPANDAAWLREFGRLSATTVVRVDYAGGTYRYDVNRKALSAAVEG